MDGYWLVSMESINVQLIKSQSQASSALLFEEKQLSGQSEVSVKPPNLSASKRNDGGNRILTDQRESIWQARGMEYSVLKNKSVLGSPSHNVLEALPWLHCHLVPYNEDHQIIKDKLNWIALWPMRSNRARLFHKYERNRFSRIYASFLMSSFAEVMFGRILIATIAVIWRKGLSSNWVTWERGDESSHIFLLVIALFWNLVLDDKVWRMIKIIIIISPVHSDKSLRKLMNWELFFSFLKDIQDRIESTGEMAATPTPHWPLHVGILLMPWLAFLLLHAVLLLCSPSSVWRRELPAVLTCFALVLPQTVVCPCNKNNQLNYVELIWQINILFVCRFVLTKTALPYGQVLNWREREQYVTEQTLPSVWNWLSSARRPRLLLYLAFIFL